MTDLAPNRETLGDDGSVRKTHYGPGRQPWDDIVEAGWGPAFAAGCVLRYLRRDKALEHSLESARWYYRQLYRRGAGGPSLNDWTVTLSHLEHLLTLEELKIVRNEP